MFGAIRVVGKKILFAFLTYVIINLFIFIVPRLMPGNYIDYLASTRFLPREAVEELYIRFGLMDPLHIQLLRYVSNVMFSLPPDFGYSYSFYPLRAWQVVQTFLPWTLLLLSTATLTTFAFGLLLGFAASYWRESVLDKVIRGFAFFTMSTPYFVLAMLFILLFSQTLRIFPAGGAYSPGTSPGSPGYVSDVLWHMVLPLAALTIGTSGQYVILAREIIIANISEEFYRTALAMGLKRSRLLLSYALRPGILPLITLFGIRFGTMLSGALLTEIVFSYPGLGYILYQAILSKDFPLLQALFYMISIMVIATSLALDTIYAVLDPRIRRAALDKG
jgi:peptide/nickel transport system permease protein